MGNARVSHGEVEFSPAGDLKIFSCEYLKGINFRGHKFSRNKFSRLTGPKSANFAEFIFAILSLIVAFSFNFLGLFNKFDDKCHKIKFRGI